MKIIIALLIFSIIIIFHELGHFSLAKANGIRVNEFCLGLGPTIFGVTKGETKYSLKLLPFGGACMMEEETARVQMTGHLAKSLSGQGSVWLPPDRCLTLSWHLSFLLSFFPKMDMMSLRSQRLARALQRNRQVCRRGMSL